MFEYLDNKYEEETPEQKKSYPVLGVFIALFVLMLSLVLFKSLDIKVELSCNDSGCSYTKYNLYQQETYQKKFTRNDIKKLSITHEMHNSYKNRNDFYEDVFHVEISPSDTINVSEEAYDQITDYCHRKYKEIYNCKYINKQKLILYGTAGVLSVLFLIGFVSQAFRKHNGNRRKRKRVRKK